MCELRVVDPSGKSDPALVSSNFGQITPECEFDVTPGLKYVVTIANTFEEELSRTINKEMNNRKNLKGSLIACVAIGALRRVLQ